MTTMTMPRPARDAGAGVPAGVWIRVSTGAQDEQSQVPDIEAHCRREGCRVAAAVRAER